jgi:hypothetical protein
MSFEWPFLFFSFYVANSRRRTNWTLRKQWERTISEGYNLINRAKLWYPYAKTPIPEKPSKSGLIWVWHKDNLYLIWTSPETPTRTHYMFQMDRWLGPRQINKPWINWISSVIFCFLLFFSWQNMNLILCAISHLLLSLIISATYKKKQREREKLDEIWRMIQFYCRNTTLSEP